MRSETAIIIPARLTSTRLLNKPLVSIKGKPLIRHVVERCAEADPGLMIVATDSEEVGKASGSAFILTSGSCATGSDRCAEAFSKSRIFADYKYVINVQGDMPFIDPSFITMLIDKRISSTADLITAESEVNFVTRDKFNSSYCRSSKRIHIGLYAFTVESLKKFASLARSSTEFFWDLEQNRMVDNNFYIETIELPYAPLEINTPADVMMLRAMGL